MLAYFQVGEDARRKAVQRSFDALKPGGTFFVVAHDSTNLTEGTGGPQDASVLYTAEDVLADLADRGYETQQAERVARHVEAGTAWDALVLVVRR